MHVGAHLNLGQVHACRCWSMHLHGQNSKASLLRQRCTAQRPSRPCSRMRAGLHLQAAKQQQQLQKDEETRYRQQQRELHEHHRQQMQLQQQECSQQAEAAHAVGMDCAHAEPEVAEGEAASPCPDLLAPLVGAATMREAALRAQALDIAFLHGKVEAADEGEEDADAEAGQPGSKRPCMASATGTKTPQARRADARTADATAAAAAVGGATLVSCV